MARRAARSRGREDSETRTSEYSIPGICGRMRCNASPMEARYNAPLNSLLYTSPPSGRCREGHDARDSGNPLKIVDKHLLILERRDGANEGEAYVRGTVSHVSLAAKARVSAATLSGRGTG